MRAYLIDPYRQTVTEIDEAGPQAEAFWESPTDTVQLREGLWLLVFRDAYRRDDLTPNLWRYKGAHGCTLSGMGMLVAFEWQRDKESAQNVRVFADAPEPAEVSWLGPVFKGFVYHEEGDRGLIDIQREVDLAGV